MVQMSALAHRSHLEMTRFGPFSDLRETSPPPLGARAMYLWQGDHDTLFRIHGTNEPWTVGQSQSSGCIRMINQDVMDLYQKTPVGARVVVLASQRPQPAKVGYQSSQNAPSRIGRP